MRTRKWDRLVLESLEQLNFVLVSIEGALDEIASVGGDTSAGRAAVEAGVLCRWLWWSSFTGDHLLVGLGSGV